MRRFWYGRYKEEASQALIVTVVWRSAMPAVEAECRKRTRFWASGILTSWKRRSMRRLRRTGDKNSGRSFSGSAARLSTAPRHAYLKIADGCDNRC